MIGGIKRKYEGPLVSVIIPVHNAGPYLLDCLQSVLNQTYRPLECVLFNDKSSDDSLEIIEEWARKVRDSHDDKGHEDDSNRSFAIVIGSSEQETAGGKSVCH